jgi:large subunit ribosomal protein L23
LDAEKAFKIVKRPYVTEKTLGLVERDNTLVFIVDDRARKEQIRRAVETLYDVKVASVNTAQTVTGKKAFVKLATGYSASDLASKIGII